MINKLMLVLALGWLFLIFWERITAPAREAAFREKIEAETRLEENGIEKEIPSEKIPQDTADHPLNVWVAQVIRAPRFKFMVILGSIILGIWLSLFLYGRAKKGRWPSLLFVLALVFSWVFAFVWVPFFFLQVLPPTLG